MKAIDLQEKVERGEALDEIELEFLATFLDLPETELAEALRPWRRL
jgi:hypothetical protein